METSYYARLVVLFLRLIKHVEAGLPAGVLESNVLLRMQDMMERLDTATETIANYTTTVENLRAANEQLKLTNEELKTTNDVLNTTIQDLKTSNEDVKANLEVLEAMMQGKLVPYIINKQISDQKLNCRELQAWQNLL